MRITPTLNADRPKQLQDFEVRARTHGFRSEIDVLRLNQLSDELETEDFQRKLAQGQQSS